MDCYKKYHSFEFILGSNTACTCLCVKPSQSLDDHHPTDYGVTLFVLIFGIPRYRLSYIDINLLSQHF